MALFNQKVQGYIANKLFLPISCWNNLSPKVQDHIYSIFVHKLHNPYNCFIHLTNRRCELKTTFEQRGRKGISACYTCPKCEQIDMCMHLGQKYVSFERFNFDAIDTLYNILEANGYIIEDNDLTTFPSVPKWKILTDKLDSERATEQERLAKVWDVERNGILVCPPRFGKTLLTAFISSKLNTRTLILVHKIELARQFYDDYLNFTTLTENEIGLNPEMEEVDNYSVSIVTYQQFIRKSGPERIRQCRKSFGLIIVDEVHKAAATKFHEVINAFYARYRLGVTATPERRDAKEFLNLFSFGPVLASGGAEQLPCDYIITPTHWNGPEPKGEQGWIALWKKLATNEERNGIITDYVIKDLNSDYKIMLPVKRHTQIQLLHTMIADKCKKHGLNVRICEYHGKLSPTHRKKLQKEIKEGQYDVVIGNEAIISLGFNAPPMSCIYINLHTYRKFEGDLYQEFSRIRTRCKGKKRPLIRIFKDNSLISDKSVSAIQSTMEKYKFTQVFEEAYATPAKKGNGMVIHHRRRMI